MSPEELIKHWRELADKLEAESDANQIYLRVEANTLRYCADELEEALKSAPSRPGQQATMKLYDWILRNGQPVDYWHAALGVGAWVPYMDAERHALDGLGPDRPPEIEQKLNGVVLPFEVLFQLLGVELDDDIARFDFSGLIADIREGKYHNRTKD